MSRKKSTSMEMVGVKGKKLRAVITGRQIKFIEIERLAKIPEGYISTALKQNRINRVYLKKICQFLGIDYKDYIEIDAIEQETLFPNLQTEAILNEIDTLKEKVERQKVQINELHEYITKIMNAFHYISSVLGEKKHENSN